MSVSPDTVRQMAQLARLALDPDRVEGLATEMSAIVAHMDTIASWPVSDTPAQATAPTWRRADEATAVLGTGLIEAAAQHAHGEVIVPPIKDAS